MKRIEHYENNMRSVMFRPTGTVTYEVFMEHHGADKKTWWVGAARTERTVIDISDIGWNYALLDYTNYNNDEDAIASYNRLVSVYADIATKEEEKA